MESVHLLNFPFNFIRRVEHGLHRHRYGGAFG